MSSLSATASDSELDCAQNSDMNLKDASEITWYFDKDDAAPMSAGPPAEPDAVPSLPPPAVKVAGSCRSGRATRPSERVLYMMDSSLAEPSHKALGKRKASARDAGPSHHCVSRKIVHLSSDSEEHDTEPAETAGEDGTEDDVQSMDYESLKAMADVDNEAFRFKTREDHTADLRTIFRREKERVDPDSGKVQDGHWCKLCLDDLSIARNECFLTGSTSSLRMHIARRRNHVKEYLKRCEELRIPMNTRCLSRIPSENSNGLRQTSLDSVVIREPKAPPFTTAGLLDYIVELVVCEDEAFRLIERGSFRHLIQYCRPGLRMRFFAAHAAENAMHQKLKDLPCKVSFTFNAWTSKAGDPYLSITGHYIDAPAGCPLEWTLKTEQLAFENIEGRHTGKNIARILTRTVDRYELRGKVGWFTCDGAAVNGTTIKEFEKDLDDRDKGWKADERQILCMEHLLHVAAKHFVEAVAPASSQKIRQKVKAALKKARKGEDLDLDILDNALSKLDNVNNEGETKSDDDDDEDDDDESTSGDVLGKALALVNQIRKSPQARTFFKSSCTQVDIKLLELLLWIKTHWASLYRFLDRILQLRKGVDQFVLLADASDEVPTLTRGRSYADFQLTKKDWDKLEVIHEMLREPSNVQQTFSSEKKPTVWRIIPSLEFLIKRWESMLGELRFPDVREAITEGIQSFKKWYRKVDHGSNAYFICLVLDPNVKDLYCRHRWDTEQYLEGMKRLEQVFDSYYIAPASGSSTASHQGLKQAPGPSDLIRAPSRYGSSYLLDAVQSFQQEEKAVGNPRDELKQYLESGIEPTDDVIRWWGQQPNTKYPTLKRIAHDYLAIQGLATPSERAFSSSGITDTQRRNSLAHEVFRALQLLKSAYRNGHIAAVSQAAEHIDALISGLDEDEGEIGNNSM